MRFQASLYVATCLAHVFGRCLSIYSYRYILSWLTEKLSPRAVSQDTVLDEIPIFRLQVWKTYANLPPVTGHFRDDSHMLNFTPLDYLSTV
ncbi:hypothetical protein GGS20DRAFT_573025 [Poronia punctata]|nr:hypothetical protein GGS20DRAFT_573025 [Poronia punctata]